MENHSAEVQAAVYEIGKTHYEVVRIFNKNRDVKDVIKETISGREKESLI